MFVVASRLQAKLSKSIGIDVDVAIDHGAADCSVGVGLTFSDPFYDQAE
jgi:hypothetical protein